MMVWCNLLAEVCILLTAVTVPVGRVRPMDYLAGFLVLPEHDLTTGANHLLKKG
jgi:hypothetical protein